MKEIFNITLQQKTNFGKSKVDIHSSCYSVSKIILLNQKSRDTYIGEYDISVAQFCTLTNIYQYGHTIGVGDEKGLP